MTRSADCSANPSVFRQASQSPRLYRRYAILGYLLLASVHLLYLPDAEFVADDWAFLGLFQKAHDAGRVEQVRVFSAMLQNTFFNQFRFNWLAGWTGYLTWLALGFSPRAIVFLVLMVHLGSAIALRDVVERLGLGSLPAFLGGALFVLHPAAHTVLFWTLACFLYTWSVLWFLLYLRSLAATVSLGSLRLREAVQQALFLLLALFSGDVSFVLLLAAAPLTAWLFRPAVVRGTTLLAWVTVVPAAAWYTIFINRAAVLNRGVGLRFEFSPALIWHNLTSGLLIYEKLTGLTASSFYHLGATPLALTAAVTACLVTILCLSRTESDSPALGRGLLWALAMWLAACAPTLALRTYELRYAYVPGPYLALALSLILAATPRRVRLPLAGILSAWLAMVAVADVQQSWSPQSRHLRAIAVRLRGLPVESGDLVVVANTPLAIGTAPHFAFQADWFSTPFVEHITGVRRLRTAREIVQDGSSLRAYHRNYISDWAPQDAARTWILVADFPVQSVVQRGLLAAPVDPAAYRLYPLKGYRGPLPAPHPHTRQQIAMLEGTIYFPKTLSHNHHPVGW